MQHTWQTAALPDTLWQLGLPGLLICSYSAHLDLNAANSLSARERPALFIDFLHPPFSTFVALLTEINWSRGWRKLPFGIMLYKKRKHEACNGMSPGMPSHGQSASA